jgi:hypothetical protein
VTEGEAVESEPVVERESAAESGVRYECAVRHKVPVHGSEPHLRRCGRRDKHRKPEQRRRRKIDHALTLHSVSPPEFRFQPSTRMRQHPFPDELNTRDG